MWVSGLSLVQALLHDGQAVPVFDRPRSLRAYNLLQLCAISSPFKFTCQLLSIRLEFLWVKVEHLLVLSRHLRLEGIWILHSLPAVLLRRFQKWQL